jgi:hypothetical protein
MQIEDTQWYWVRDVAGHCVVSVATIYRATESGQLAAVRFGRGTGVFWVSGAAVLADGQACAQAAGELLRSTMRGRWGWRHEAGGSEGVHGGAVVPAFSAGGVSVVGVHCRCCCGHGIGPPGGDGRFECQVDPEGVLSPEERACRGTAACGRISRRGRCAAPGPAPRRPLSIGQRAFGRARHAAGPAARGRGEVMGLCVWPWWGRCLGLRADHDAQEANAGGVRRCLPAQSLAVGLCDDGVVVAPVWCPRAGRDPRHRGAHALWMRSR